MPNIPQYALEQIQLLRNNNYKLRSQYKESYKDDLKNIEFIAFDSPLAEKIATAKAETVKKLISDTITILQSLPKEDPASYNVWLTAQDNVYDYVTNLVKYPVKDMYEVLENAQCGLVFYHTASLQLDDYLKKNPAASTKLLERCTEFTNKVRMIVANTIVNKATSEVDCKKLKEGLDGKFLKDALVLIRCIGERNFDIFQNTIAKLQQIADLNPYSDVDIEHCYEEVMRYHRDNKEEEKTIEFNKIIETFTEKPVNYENVELVRDAIMVLYRFVIQGVYPAADMAMQICMFVHETPDVFDFGVEHVIRLLEDYQEKEGERLWQMATKGLGLAAIKLGSNPNIEDAEKKMDLVLGQLDLLMYKYPEQKKLLLESSYIAQDIDGKKETKRMWELLGKPEEKFEDGWGKENEGRDIIVKVFTPKAILIRIENLLEIYPYDVMEGLKGCSIKTINADILKEYNIARTVLKVAKKIPDGEADMSKVIWGLYSDLISDGDPKVVDNQKTDAISEIIKSISDKKILNTNDAVALNTAAELFGTTKPISLLLDMQIRKYFVHTMYDEEYEAVQPYGIEFLKTFADRAIKEKDDFILTHFFESFYLWRMTTDVKMIVNIESLLGLYKDIYTKLAEDKDFYTKCIETFTKKLENLHVHKNYLLNVYEKKVNKTLFKAFYELVVFALNTHSKHVNEYDDTYWGLIGMYRWFIENYEIALNDVPTTKWEKDQKTYEKGYSGQKSIDDDIISNLSEYASNVNEGDTNFNRFSIVSMDDVPSSGIII